MSKQKVPRKHHYVPQFHIRRFADARGRVHAYDRIKGNHLRDQRPRSILKKRDLYRARTIDESQEFELEHILAVGEANWSRIVATIISEGVVSSESIPDLVEYLAFQIVRTLQQRENMRALSDHFSTGMAILELRAQQESGELGHSERAAVDEFIADANKGELRAIESESHMLRNQMSGLALMVEILEDGWHFVVVSLNHPGFVLSDHPIALLGDWDGTITTGIGPAIAEEIWMPLDPSHALVLTRDYNQPRHILALPRSHARRISQRLALESSRWTIYRPGTDPLKQMAIPKEPPQMFVDEYAVHGQDGGSLIQIGRERPHVEGERSLSGRLLRPFPTRAHNVIDSQQPWLPDQDPPPSSLPAVGIDGLPPYLASALRNSTIDPETGEITFPDLVRFPHAGE